MDRLREADEGLVVPILPLASVVKVGAQSLIDRGRSPFTPSSRSWVPTVASTS
ncbi:MAG: hypothetical protein JO057_04460 [Chloroflexi bacterium]|nr:hypothetical protein [Chloroflexota bacterium]